MYNSTALSLSQKSHAKDLPLMRLQLCMMRLQPAKHAKTTNHLSKSADLVRMLEYNKSNHAGPATPATRRSSDSAFDRLLVSMLVDGGC